MPDRQAPTGSTEAIGSFDNMSSSKPLQGVTDAEFSLRSCQREGHGTLKFTKCSSTQNRSASTGLVRLHFSSSSNGRQSISESDGRDRMVSSIENNISSHEHISFEFQGHPI